jgi:hypothetical protein
MRSPVATAIAIVTLLIVLLGYFLPQLAVLHYIQTTFLEWAVILASVAALVAIINLVFGVHWRKIKAAQNRDYYSPVLIVAFLLTSVAGFILGPADTNFQHVVTSIQAPIASSLMALLAVSLAFACARLFRLRRGLMGWTFIGSAVLFLALEIVAITGQTPPAFLPLLQLFPLAGARGILLGIALGSLVAGLRILLGSDRPYSG